jgi:ribosomal protein L4
MEATGKVLVVLDRGDEAAARSFSNLPQVILTAPGRLATYDVLWAETVVFSRETVGRSGGGTRYEVAGDDFVREEGDTE